MAINVYIFPIQLYSLKAVRRIRTHFNISARQLSKGIGKSLNYIGTMENEQIDSSYSDEILSLIATYINTFIAENSDIELEIKEKRTYTIYDFYPSDVLSDEKILKKIEPIPLGSGPTVTLNALIENTLFFNNPRTLKDIVNECNTIQNQKWTSQDFTQPLENAVKGKNKRLRIILTAKGLNTYQSIKKRRKR